MLDRGWRTALLLVLIVSVGIWTAKPGAAATKSPRMIDDIDRVVVERSVPPLAQARYKVGRANAGLRMEQLILSLSLRPGGKERLERHLAGQHDPQSPLYHKWLTPEQYGSRFGLRDEDIETVKTWLTDNGFIIEEVAKGRGWINFSGTASKVERAFKTEIHDYLIDGKLYYANAKEISIPRDVGDMVRGIVGLDNFPLSANLRRLPPEKSNTPQSSSKSFFNYHLVPSDFATIYNLNPAYNAGITGAGTTVAIVARSNIELADVQLFRSTFDLPVNDPVIIHNGPAPVYLDPKERESEEREALLDVQWAGAVAKNATVKFVISQSVELSAQYIVDNNIADTMSTSFGLCESFMSSTRLGFYNDLWMQAASQGITSFVASGDSGAAGCELPSASIGFSRAVSGLCSTPYNICVGGTQFDDDGGWWSWSGDARSYIPEAAWNQSDSVQGGTELWSTGGGKSNIYAKPAFQVAPGVPNDGVRDVPDVSLAAATNIPYTIYHHQAREYVGGTSAASPAFAGIMALIVQKTGERQGNANTVFYPMAVAQLNGTGAVVFHDITSGNNTVPGVVGFSCTTGYDLVTGLGSVDGSALIDNWRQVLLPPSVNTSASPAAVSLHGVTYVFYKGSGSDPGIYVSSSASSISPGIWTNAKRLPWEINTSSAPSAVVSDENTICVAYKGSGDDTAIYVACTPNATATWFMTRLPWQVNTSTGPDLYVSEGGLHVFYKGSGSDARIYIAPIPANAQWTRVGDY